MLTAFLDTRVSSETPEIQRVEETLEGLRFLQWLWGRDMGSSSYYAGIDSIFKPVLWWLGTSLVGQTVKNLPAMQETWVRSLAQEDPLGKGMATHSSILAWRIPWTEEPGGLQSMVSQRVGRNWVIKHGMTWRNNDFIYLFHWSKGTSKVA